METTRPEASEITGTARAMSGFTVPVTTNSGAVACAVAVATGNCSGCWTEKTLTSNPGTILAEGGASALYEGLGFTLAGEIPDYAFKPHGGLTGTLIYWKRLVE